MSKAQYRLTCEPEEKEKWIRAKEKMASELPNPGKFSLADWMRITLNREAERILGETDREKGREVIAKKRK